MPVRAAPLLLLAACGGSSAAGSDARGADSANHQRHVAITFDELAGNTIVAAQYAPDVTLASSVGHVVALDPGDFGQSKPNFICSGDADCAEDYTLTFARGVSGLRFDAIGVNDTGTIATVELTPGGSVPLVGQGMLDVPVHVDLSTYAGVTRVAITHITDTAGIGIDNIAFDVPE